MGYDKKKKEKKSMPKGMREKIQAKQHERNNNNNNPILNNMKKKKERKVAHTFKGNHQKERESCSKEYKIFRIRKISKFHTLALLDQSV